MFFFVSLVSKLRHHDSSRQERRSTLITLPMKDMPNVSGIEEQHRAHIEEPRNLFQFLLAVVARRQQRHQQNIWCILMP